MDKSGIQLLEGISISHRWPSAPDFMTFKAFLHNSITLMKCEKRLIDTTKPNHQDLHRHVVFLKTPVGSVETKKSKIKLCHYCIVNGALDLCKFSEISIDRYPDK